jgi:putative methyltransferase (TIGR04325 family)
MTKPSKTGIKNAKKLVKFLLQIPSATFARVMAGTRRSARFTGIYQSRSAAIAALPKAKQAGYDDASLADVSFSQMCQKEVWDYPLIYWLERILPEINSLTDAGGHLGTKYIAFSVVLDLGQIEWVVYDLPEIISAAQAKQKLGEVPDAIRFESEIEGAPTGELLIASGLFQYLDISFAEFFSNMKQRPKHILINKVATYDTDSFFTIERIGNGRVPYHVRNRDLWEAEIANLGYRIVDEWDIANLGHRISTHPWQPNSQSRGYYLVAIT